MANQYTLHLLAPPAVDLLDNVAAVIKEAFDAHPITVQIRSNLPATQWTISERAASTITFQDGDSSTRAFFEARPHLEVTGLTVSWKDRVGPKHNQSTQQCSLKYEMADLPGAMQFILDEVKAPERAVALADALHKHFELSRPATLALKAMPEPMRDAVQLQHTSLQTLSAEVAKIASFTTAQAQRNADHISQMTKDLQEQFQTRHAALDEEYQEKTKSLEASFQRRKETLDKREEEVKKQEFDLRENTAVRRDLLTRIRSHLDEYKVASLSPSVTSKRLMIHIVCPTVLGGSGVALLYILFLLFEGRLDNLDWRYAAPMVFLGGLFATTLWYYVRWNDQWFREHADAELGTRKLMADILRANWLAELVFEYKDGQLPDTLLKQFSTDLFRAPKGAATRHPYDAAEDFLKAITRVKVGTQDVEIEKKAKKIRVSEAD